MQFSHDQAFRNQDHGLHLVVRAAWMLAGVLLIGSVATAKSGTPAERRSFDAVTRTLIGYFATLKDYEAGDLVSQSRVADALKHVTDTTGWDDPNRDGIVKLALADNSFIVTQLSTPSGRPFMRKIAKYAGSYSRLDRLSTISGGQQFIKDIVSKKGGADMMEYLATTSGGHHLGKMLAGAKNGVDLNMPTGRIYTVDDLLAELKRAYGKKSQ